MREDWREVWEWEGRNEQGRPSEGWGNSLKKPLQTILEDYFFKDTFYISTMQQSITSNICIAFNTSWEEVDVDVLVPFSGHLDVEHSHPSYLWLPVSCVFNSHIFNLECDLDWVGFGVHLEVVILFRCVIAVFEGHTLFQININIWHWYLNWT